MKALIVLVSVVSILQSEAGATCGLDKYMGCRSECASRADEFVEMASAEMPDNAELRLFAMIEGESRRQACAKFCLEDYRRACGN